MIRNFRDFSDFYVFSGKTRVRTHFEAQIMVEIRITTEFTWYTPSCFVFTISFNRFQIHSLTFVLHGLTRYLLRNKNCNSKDVRKSQSFLEKSINFLIP